MDAGDDSTIVDADEHLHLHLHHHHDTDGFDISSGDDDEEEEEERPKPSSFASYRHIFAGLVEEETAKPQAFGSYRHKLTEILKNLHSAEAKVYSEASKEFIGLLKGDNGGDVLREYIQLSPRCSELTEVWGLHQGKSGMSHIMSLVSAVLDHPEGKTRAGGIKRSLDDFARVVVDGKLDDVYDELRSEESRRQSTALLLLASVVRRGMGLASEVAKNFDFKLPALSKIYGVQTKKRKKRGKDTGRGMKKSTRRAFVRFAVSFLEVGNPRLLRWILRQKEMFSGVFRWLGSDDVETVVHVLATLRDKVLTEQSLVPPALRSVLFGSATLEQLSYISGNPMAGPAVDVAHEVLARVCTDPRNGLMPGLTLKGNEKRLLELMKKLKATEARYHRDLLLAIVNGRPSLCSAYMDEFPYHLEPRPSILWFSAISLATDIISSVNANMVIETLASHFDDPPAMNSAELQNIFKCIIPRAFTRSVINKGLLHSDTYVKHGSLRLLLESVKSLSNQISAVDDIIKRLRTKEAVEMAGGRIGNLYGLPGFSCFENVDKCLDVNHVESPCCEEKHSEKWLFLKQYIQDEVRALLPDPQVLLKLLSLARINLKRHADVPYFGSKKVKSIASSEGMDIVIGGIDTNIAGDIPEVWGMGIHSCTNKDLDGEKHQIVTIADIWDLSYLTGLANETKQAENFFQSKLLDVLTCYLRTIPIAFEGSLDFFKLLPVNPLILTIDQLSSLLSLLVEYIGHPSGSKASGRAPEFMYRNLQPLITVLICSQDKDIQDLARILARAAMISTGAFDQNILEIDTWFLFLPGYNSKMHAEGSHGAGALHELSAVISSFLCDAVSTVGNNLYKYLDHLRKLITKSADNQAVCTANAPGFSPLVFVVLQKCLRLLESDSGTFKLHEKALISMYVCNTLSLILQTQVEMKLLPVLIHQFLTENLKDCYLIDDDPKSSRCEWMPLKKLLFFAQDMLQQQNRNLFAVPESCSRGDSGTLFPILGKVKEFLERSHGRELDGVAIALSSSIICATYEDILANFPLLLSITQLHFRSNLSVLSSLLFLERKLLPNVAELWPDVFSALEMLEITPNNNYRGNGEHLLGTAEVTQCANMTPCTEYLNSIGSDASNFCLLLKHTPFYVLFCSLLAFGNYGSHSTRFVCTMNSSKLLDLLRAKLSEGSIDDSILSLRFVLFWAYHILISHRASPSDVLEELFQTCFTLVEYIFEHLFAADRIDFTEDTSNATTVVEIICSHPLVSISLSRPLCWGRDLDHESLRNNADTFLASAKQNFHPMDDRILQFLRKAFYLLLARGNDREPVVMAFRQLGQKSSLLLREKFLLCFEKNDLRPLSLSFYTFHILMDFMSPFELFELVHWMFVELEDRASGYKPVFWSAVEVGLCIADGAMDLLCSYLVNPDQWSKSKLLWDRKFMSFDISILYKVYYKILDFCTCCNVELADRFLLKVVSAASGQHFAKPIPVLLPLWMLFSRMIASAPIKMLVHLLCPTSKIKAKTLLLLTEVSPLHLRLFGHTFLSILNNNLAFMDILNDSGIGQLKSELADGNCDYGLSEDEFVLLLPSALSYLKYNLDSCNKKDHRMLEIIPTFYSGILLDGFLDWKQYVSRDVFQEEFHDFTPISFDDCEKLFSTSLLGNAVTMLRYFFMLTENSMKRKKRIEIFNVLYPNSASIAELLDCDLKEFNSCSVEDSIRLINQVVAKMSFTMLLLVPPNKLQFLTTEDESTKMIQGCNSNRMNCTKLRFINILVNTLEVIMRKYPLRKDWSKIYCSADGFHVFTFLEYSILKNIIQLSTDIRSFLVQLPSIPFVNLFIKSCFLYRYGDPTALKAIRCLVVILSEGKVSCTEVLQLLLGHSQFISMILSSDGISRSTTFIPGGSLLQPLPSILKLIDTSARQHASQGNSLDGSSESRFGQWFLGREKLELIRLLRALYYIKGRQQIVGPVNVDGMNIRELLSLLLSGYSATLSEIDLEILSLMDEIELIEGSENGSIADINYLWGSSALKVREEVMRDTRGASENISDFEPIEERHKMLFRENIPVDVNLCATTVLHFCYDRSSRTDSLSLEMVLQDNFVDSKLQSPLSNVEVVYDPVFILRFSIHILSIGYIDPVEFSRLGLLAITFVSIASPDDTLRKLGYESLGMFKIALENSQDSKDTLQLQLLLTFIQNGITKPWQKIPSVISIFAAEASFALLDPSQEHFLSISKTIMRSPKTNLKDIPLFDKLFKRDSIHFKTNWLWILRLLYVGLNVDADVDIYIKRELPELLLSFFTSSLLHPESMILILQLVKKAVKFHKQLEHLVQHCGLISWLSSVVSLYTERLSGDQKDFSLKTLGFALKVINDVISSKEILEWLQDFALEQLSEFLCHLHKLFFGYLNLLKDDISLVNSILLVMLSTLRISQKRKINEPHFTLSLRGLFQLYQAICDNITDAGFSHTIELGIITILMSTPVPVVTHMDRARLSRLLNWIVSSASWSPSNQRPLRNESDPSLAISLREQEREESLVSKLLRWVTASVILGSISERLYTENTFNFKRPELKTLQSLLERAKNERSEIGENGCSSREALAIIILYLQQLLKVKYTCLPSVISALCLLLPYAASNATENELLDENTGLIVSLISKIRCPVEANPAWRWLFDQPWEDCSSERMEMELMEEEHACQSLLIIFSNALGGKSVGLPELSHTDVKRFGLFEWEMRTFVGSRPCRTHERGK